MTLEKQIKDLSTRAELVGYYKVLIDLKNIIEKKMKVVETQMKELDSEPLLLKKEWIVNDEKSENTNSKQ
jgi:hypothetical protein|tara:strand:- start:101 stop:310 length:210 start_codon:yes stop_codon:yes gene_type:complete